MLHVNVIDITEGREEGIQKRVGWGHWKASEPFGAIPREATCQRRFPPLMEYLRIAVFGGGEISRKRRRVTQEEKQERGVADLRLVDNASPERVFHRGPGPMERDASAMSRRKLAASGEASARAVPGIDRYEARSLGEILRGERPLGAYDASRGSAARIGAASPIAYQGKRTSARSPYGDRKRHGQARCGKAHGRNHAAKLGKRARNVAVAPNNERSEVSRAETRNDVETDVCNLREARIRSRIGRAIGSRAVPPLPACLSVARMPLTYSQPRPEVSTGQ
ncbi:hypothetical protein KM043_003309 [Ampulex compressa]|nr:hypothetical protein KM043_003309 [Ampulex compressa]